MRRLLLVVFALAHIIFVAEASAGVCSGAASILQGITTTSMIIQQTFSGRAEEYDWQFSPCQATPAFGCATPAYVTVATKSHSECLTYFTTFAPSTPTWALRANDTFVATIQTAASASNNMKLTIACDPTVENLVNDGPIAAATTNGGGYVWVATMKSKHACTAATPVPPPATPTPAATPTLAPPSAVCSGAASGLQIIPPTKLLINQSYDGYSATFDWMFSPCRPSTAFGCGTAAYVNQATGPGSCLSFDAFTVPTWLVVGNGLYASVRSTDSSVPKSMNIFITCDATVEGLVSDGPIVASSTNSGGYVWVARLRSKQACASQMTL